MKFEDDELADEEFNPDQKIILHESLSEFYASRENEEELKDAPIIEDMKT